MFLAGCSESGFPSLHDVPPPRTDATLTPDQVQQATDTLITERDHLSSQAQANGEQNPPSNAGGNTQQPNAAAAGRPVLTPVVATGSTPTAGVNAKP